MALPPSTLPSSFTQSGLPSGWRHHLHSWTCPCSIMYLPKDSSHGHIQNCAFLTVASFTLEITPAYIYLTTILTKARNLSSWGVRNHAFTFVGHGSTKGDFLHGLLLIFRDLVSVNPAIRDWLGGRPAGYPEPSFFTSLDWMTGICCHIWHFYLIPWVLAI